jgi:hypothetical protein
MYEVVKRIHLDRGGQVQEKQDQWEGAKTQLAHDSAFLCRLHFNQIWRKLLRVRAYCNSIACVWVPSVYEGLKILATAEKEKGRLFRCPSQVN